MSITYRHYGHADMDAELRQTLIDVHHDAWGPEGMQDPFNQRIGWFIDHWSGRPDWTCAVGYDEQGAMGFAYGAPATPGREWWREHTSIDGDTSTYHLSEIAVAQRWRKTGESKRLHDELLADRPEKLVALTADRDHPKVVALYASWGYESLGLVQPFDDSPTYRVMLLRR
jgi:GNAT superfamily N-acetyltransferase